MTPDRTRHLLWLTTALIIIATVAIVVLHNLLPARFEPQEITSTSQPIGGQAANLSPDNEDAGELTAESFSAFWYRQYRRPLVDPPPPVPAIKPPPPPPPPLRVTLVGTVVEPDTPAAAQAMFETARGKVEFRRIGDEIGGAQLLRIELSAVVLLYHGEEHRIDLKKNDQ